MKARVYHAIGTTTLQIRLSGVTMSTYKQTLLSPRLLVIPACLALTTMALPFAAAAQIGLDISVTVPPPELPVYEQPPLPEPGYIWTPGYWSYGDDGYFWVPGTWVEPPSPGLLWTPGYWGWNAGRFIFNAGYWGPQVGFYGGVDYGFGYGGEGYEGGYWRGGVFSYNGSVNNFGGVHVTNVYQKTVVNRVSVNRVSYNGGQGGIDRRPTPQQAAYAHASHTPPTAAQVQHKQVAARTPELRASTNHGSPPAALAATSKPGEISRASGAATSRPGAASRPGEANPASHPGETRANETRSGVARPGEEPAREPAAHETARPGHEARTGAEAEHSTRPTPPERTARHVARPAAPAATRETPRSEPEAAHRPAAEPRAAAPRPAAMPRPEAVPHAAPHTAPAARPEPGKQPER
jgi:hypothetical protein